MSNLSFLEGMLAAERRRKRKSLLFWLCVGLACLLFLALAGELPELEIITP